MVSILRYKALLNGVLKQFSAHILVFAFYKQFIFMIFLWKYFVFIKDENLNIEVNLELGFKLYSCWKRKLKNMSPRFDNMTNFKTLGMLFVQN